MWCPVLWGVTRGKARTSPRSATCWELAQGKTSWWNPLLGGMAPETDGLLPYWLGALAIQWAPAGLTPTWQHGCPSAGMLVLTLIATWYGVYYLARSPAAQPVAFAFGGEAQPTDYARAMADGGLLALLACLGLAQLSHEATSYLVQLCCTTLVFFGFAALGSHTVAPALALAAGLAGLTLAGAPALAAMLGLGGAWLVWRSASVDIARPAQMGRSNLILVAAVALMAWQLDLWRWRLVGTDAGGKEWASLARLMPVVWLACVAPGHLDTVALAQANCQHPVAPPPVVATVVLAGIGGCHHQHSTGRPGPAAGPARYGHAGSFCPAHTEPGGGCVD